MDSKGASAMTFVLKNGTLRQEPGYMVVKATAESITLVPAEDLLEEEELIPVDDEEESAEEGEEEELVPEEPEEPAAPEVQKETFEVELYIREGAVFRTDGTDLAFSAESFGKEGKDLPVARVLFDEDGYAIRLEAAQQ